MQALLWQASAALSTHGKSHLLLLLVAALLLEHTSALYHTSSEVLHWFSHCAVKRPEVLRFRELHERQTNTAVPVATISQGISSPTYTHKPAVLFVFGEHAREVITPEVGIWFARMLVNTNSSVYDWPELSAAFERAGIDTTGRSLNISSAAAKSPTAAATASSTTAAERQQGKAAWPQVARGWVRELLRQFEVVIVPIEALGSRRLVEAGQLCVRKSASNVDLNRNWPYAWKKESATDEQYGGPSPFSEPQSRLMKHLIDHLTGRLLGYVNVHSGEWALYTPWDSKQAYGPGLPADLPDLVSKVGRLCDCKAGPAGAVSGYLAYGTSMDYLYVHKRVPYPLTVEVYGGDNIGKLSPGEANKVLTAWPTVTKAGAHIAASAQFQRRHLLQQEDHAQQGGVAGAPWGRSLSALLRALLQDNQQEKTGVDQQSWQQQRRRRRRRRHNRLQHLRAFAAAEAGDSKLPLLPNVGPADAAAPIPAASGSVQQQVPAVRPAGSFSAGGNLDQLRQQAKQQLLQQPPTGSAPVLSIPTDGTAGQGQQAAAPDAILATVAAAGSMEKGCFKAFNPETEAEYRRVVADWLAASLIMVKHMADSKEGQDMIAKVAASPAMFNRASSKAQNSGISMHEPRVNRNSSGSPRDLLAGTC